MLGAMTILTKTIEWKSPGERRRFSDLTSDEHQRVRVALRFLARRLGSWKALAAAMRAKESTVTYTASARSKPSAGVALRAARAAGVPLEDILSGAFPPADTCPHCGRSGT